MDAPQPQTTTSPNEELAQRITAVLVARQLVPSDKEAEIRRKLAAGTVTQDEWKLWVDLALPREAKK